MLKLALIVGGGLSAGVIFAAHQVAAQPAGSYMQSCRRIEQRGPNLFALCRNVQGQWVRSIINARACRGPIANNDGQLTCSGAVGRVHEPEHRRDDRRYEDRDRRDRYRRDDERDRDYDERDPRVSPYPGYDQSPN